MNTDQATVDYRLLQQRSALLLCTTCFRRGVTTPIAQVVSSRHRLKTQCRRCAQKK